MSESRAALHGQPFEEPTVVVVTYRDSDSDNETRVFGARAIVVDVDNGRGDLDQPEEFLWWASHHLGTVHDLRAGGQTDAAEHLEALIRREWEYRFGQGRPTSSSTDLPWSEVLDLTMSERGEGVNP